MACLRQNGRESRSINCSYEPWVRQGRYSSIAQSVEHSAVNRVVVGSSPTGGAKRILTINSWCWWRRGSTPRPRGLRSLRADLAIRSRIASSLVLSPKSGAFRRPHFPNTEVKPCSAENTWLATARENRKMPTSDSEYFFYLDYFKHCKRCFFFFLKIKLPHTILVISIIFGLKIRFFTKLLTDFFRSCDDYFLL